MPLPSSGPISMSQINQELGRSSNASISLDTAENGGYGAIKECANPRPSANNPATISEWYGYNHSVTCTVNCGGTESVQTGTDCGTENIKEVLLGGNVSGDVDVSYTFSIDSGYSLNQLRIYIMYNGTNVADTGTLTVYSYQSPTSLSGTLTFTATGATDRYYIHYYDPYCY